VPEVKPFDPFAEDAPEPSVEVVGHGHDERAPEPPAPEPPAPEIMRSEAPDVEVIRDEAMPEPPAPEPMRPSIPAVPPPPPAEEPLSPAAARPAPAEPEPAPRPEPDPEPEHVDGIRDDGSSRVNVKPIETVSAMELLMQEAEEQDQHRR
jgi:hypothetical protein